MPVGDRRDPFLSYNFIVEIDGIARAGFREASGLDSSQDPVEYREGTDAFTSRKVPGMVKYGNITLKWGTTGDQELLKWRQKSADGKVQRRNGSIVLLDGAGQEQVRWNFHEAWPTKWTGPSFNATGNEVAIETLELAHEGLALQG
jgi:phage tail-like protein